MQFKVNKVANTLRCKYIKYVPENGDNEILSNTTLENINEKKHLY